MTKINDYIEKAKNLQNLPSDRALSAKLCLHKNAVHEWRNSVCLPVNDFTMVQLAELAGIPAQTALIDLTIWRAEKKGDVETVALYRQIAEKIKSS